MPEAGSVFNVPINASHKDTPLVCTDTKMDLCQLWYTSHPAKFHIEVSSHASLVKIPKHKSAPTTGVRRARRVPNTNQKQQLMRTTLTSTVLTSIFLSNLGILTAII